jgi:hypothetical protein
VDGMPAELFTFGHDDMDLIVLKVFRLLETLVAIPSNWKKAHIKLIFKGKGDSEDVKNYRPIALTVVLRRLYEKFIERRYAKKYELLAKTQGGFRAHRSTNDQIAILHDLIVSNHRLLVTFLDIKAAFDTVDRRILWTVLIKKFSFNVTTVMLLRSLFDDNICSLLINCVESADINHLRGLFQGSSLSPGLFNFFINSLLVELSEHDSGIQVTPSIKINNLFFADDGSLITTNVVDAQSTLNICERWSHRAGIEFAPSKCAFFTKNINIAPKLLLYNVQLELVQNYRYLGLFVSPKGIDWIKSMENRIKNSISLLNWLCVRGMKVLDWRPASCFAVYKSFIRPKFETGLALQIIPAEVCLSLQKTQDYALRRIFCTNKHTSIALMHSIAAFETMSYRNERLNARFLHNIINGPKKDILIGEIIQYQLTSDVDSIENLDPSSILGNFVSNNSFSTCILDNNMPTEDRWKEFKEENIYSILLDGIRKNKSGCKRLDTNNRPGRRDLLLSSVNCVLLPRKVVFTLLQWKLGRFSTHIICRCCSNNNVATTEHILSCATDVFNVSYDLQIISLLQDRMKKRRVESVVELIDRSISYLAHCNTNNDRHLLCVLANFLDVARYKSLDQEITPEDPPEVDDKDFYLEKVHSKRNLFKNKTYKKYRLGYKI